MKLLLSDSTNACRPGFTPSETTVGDTLRSVFRDYPNQRLIVASFASHLHRVRQVAEAGDHRRSPGRVPRAVDGATTSRSGARWACSTSPSSSVIDIEEVPRYAPGEVCIICTGSQGEPMSALSLMAAHEHKHVKISSDDVVVISAHAIPGNETNVTRIIDSLHRAGAEVLHGGSSPVHVSGHASQEELKMLLNIVQPEWFVPVHGEYTHMVHHARLAEAVGVAKDHVLICEDGDMLVIEQRRRRHHRDRRRAARGARRVTSTSTASSATSARACCATAATSPRRGWWW